MAEVMHGSRLALPISLELRAIPSRTMAYASPLIALVLTMVFGLLHCWATTQWPACACS